MLLPIVHGTSPPKNSFEHRTTSLPFIFTNTAVEIFPPSPLAVKIENLDLSGFCGRGFASSAARFSSAAARRRPLSTIFPTLQAAFKSAGFAFSASPKAALPPASASSSKEDMRRFAACWRPSHRAAEE